MLKSSASKRLGIKGRRRRTGKSKKAKALSTQRPKTIILPPVVAPAGDDILKNKPSWNLLHSEGFDTSHGTLRPKGWAAILKACKGLPKKNAVFFDLGCGDGRLVHTVATLSSQFSDILGVEVMGDRLAEAQALAVHDSQDNPDVLPRIITGEGLETFRSGLPEQFQGQRLETVTFEYLKPESEEKNLTRLTFLHQSIIAIEPVVMKQADLVLLDVFLHENVGGLALALKALKPGSFVVIYESLNNLAIECHLREDPAFRLVEAVMGVDTSWSNWATFLVFKRV